MIALVLLIFFIIGCMDLPHLIADRHWRDLAVYSVLFSFALVITVMLTFGAELPSSTLWVEHMIKDVLHLNYAQ